MLATLLCSGSPARLAPRDMSSANSNRSAPTTPTGCAERAPPHLGCCAVALVDPGCLTMAGSMSSLRDSTGHVVGGRPSESKIGLVLALLARLAVDFGAGATLATYTVTGHLRIISCRITLRRTNADRPEPGRFAAGLSSARYLEASDVLTTGCFARFVGSTASRLRTRAGPGLGSGSGSGQRPETTIDLPPFGEPTGEGASSPTGRCAQGGHMNKKLNYLAHFSVERPSVLRTHQAVMN